MLCSNCLSNSDAKLHYVMARSSSPDVVAERHLAVSQNQHTIALLLRAFSREVILNVIYY